MGIALFETGLEPRWEDRAPLNPVRGRLVVIGRDRETNDSVSELLAFDSADGVLEEGR